MEIRSGGDVKGKKIKFLQGLVMRKARGQANPESVLRLLETMLRRE
jgi:aspartyl-tRNA(Asn)/glutamyl-tRNA(Gln) amidotransferase subunit B